MSRTLLQTTTTDADFEAVVSAWDETLQCEISCRGQRCRRAATKRVNMHGCRRRLMCSQHAHNYVRDTLAAFRRTRLKCAFCGRLIASVSEAVEVTAL
jgi:hypothetical protein